MAQNQNNNLGVVPIIGVGYGGGGNYYAEQAIANSLRNNEFTRRRERIYDKYQIDTDSYSQYRKSHGGSWIGRALGIGLALGGIVMGAIAIATTAPIWFAGALGAMAALIGTAITTSIKDSKDNKGYNQYLDRSEKEGRHREHLKQAEIQPEKAASIIPDQGKAMAAAKSALPDAEMASYSVTAIPQNVVKDPETLGEKLQPKPEHELVSAGRSGNNRAD